MLLLSVSLAKSALAQSPEQNAREAFESGLAAESAGDGKRACELYRKSLQLLRELGPLRKSTNCDMNEGRLIAARAALDELIARWPRTGAELDDLKRERAAVAARIPKLTLEARAGSTVTVRVDGTTVTVPSTIELDPGAHDVSVEEAGQPPKSIGVRLEEGQRTSLTVPETSSTSASSDDPSGGPSGILVGGIVGLGVGGLALIGAGITGGLVIAKDADHEACVKESDCASLADEGNALLDANTALWITGLVAAGVGATLLIVEAVSGPSVEASIGPASASLRVTF